MKRILSSRLGFFIVFYLPLCSFSVISFAAANPRAVAKLAKKVQPLTVLAMCAFHKKKKDKATREKFAALGNLEKRLVAKEYYFLVKKKTYRMHSFFKVHFDGVSVKDLINHNEMPAIANNTLDLGDMNLNCLDLWSIPDTGNIQNLNLSVNKLALLPDAIGNLQQLRRLTLSFNQLKSLPGGIGNLKLLRDLYLFKNQLTFLPDAIGNLPQLQLLGLFNNQLISIPNTIGNLKQLKFLYLFENQLQTLPDTIGNLELLEKLDLSHNQLTSLPDAIGNLQQLKNFCVDKKTADANPELINNLRNRGVKVEIVNE